jgi:hypothetical protein
VTTALPKRESHSESMKRWSKLRKVNDWGSLSKNATVLALVGLILLTVLLADDFINDVEAGLQGLIPSIRLLRSTIYLFASVAMTGFLFAFYRHHA